MTKTELMVKYSYLRSKASLLLAAFVMLAMGMDAQDIHYSQFNHAPMLMNPAQTGLFDGEHRVMANYRTQWNTVPVGYRTVSGVFDTKAFRQDDGNSFFGFGALFNYDEAGDTELGTADLGLLGSYSHKIFKKHWLTAGVQLKGSQRRFNTENVRTDNQWNGGEFDPNLLIGENFDNQTIIYGDISAGINWRYEKDNSRTSMDFGLAMHHINQPKKTFMADLDEKLPNRRTWYGLLNFQATPLMDIVFNMVGNYQTPYIEHVVGVGGRLHLSQQRTKELSMLLGVNYRFNDGLGNDDALFPMVVVEYQSWRVGISYDVDISQFNLGSRGTAGNGGPELSLRYLFKKVGQPDFCPTCPAYL